MKSCSHGYLKNSEGNTQAKLKLKFPNIIQHIYKHTIHSGTQTFYQVTMN